MGASVYANVELNPEVEAALSVRLASLNEEILNYPLLQVAVANVPTDMAGWTALSQDEIFDKLHLFSNQKAAFIRTVVMMYPDQVDKLAGFIETSHNLILAIAEAIEVAAESSQPISASHSPSSDLNFSSLNSVSASDSMPGRVRPNREAVNNPRENLPSSYLAGDQTIDSTLSSRPPTSAEGHALNFVASSPVAFQSWAVGAMAWLMTLYV